MDQAKILALKKKAEEDKGFFTKLSEKTDSYLQDKVVNPLAEKGYGDVGAGIASVPSAAMQLLVNREKQNTKPDAILAGEGIGGKMKPSHSGVGRVGKIAEDAMPDSVRLQVQDEMMKRGMSMAEAAEKINKLEKDGMWKSVLNPGKSTEATRGLDEAGRMKVQAMFEKKK